jgi:prepilin-type N-terminal cleavage/methylation domain-containing protein
MRNTEKTNNVETFCQNVSTKNVSTKNISRKGKNAFTLVELIIVITILAILATIWFMSYQSYTRDARDTNRTTTLKTLSDWLTIYKAKNSSYPMPDSPVTISLSWTAISYEWQAGATVLSSIKSSDAKDPLDNNYYTYLINANKSSFQLMWYLENSVAYSPRLWGEGLGVRAQQTYARDYTTRIPKTQWDILWILLDSTTNTPISTPIDLFLSQSWTIYKAVITDKVIKTLNWAGLGWWLQMLSIKWWKMRAPSNCEAWYIWVPGNPDFMQPGFCVAKYEMKKVSGVATSQASWNLWIRITQPQAITACNNLWAWYHLITNNEWMTIARNIEANSQNWADWIVGSLVWSGWWLYRWNVGLYDSVSCGSGAALDWNTAGSGCVNSSGRNKRMHILSNWNEIWDISW